MMSEHSVPIQITFTPEFKRQYKRLTKKYSSLDSDMQNLIKILQESPNTGKPLGQSVYKIRLAISSKRKGKAVEPE